MNVRKRLPAASSTLPTCVSSIPRTHRRFWRLSPSEHFHQHRPFISLGSIPPHLKASISSQAAQRSNSILPSSLHESYETAAVAAPGKAGKLSLPAAKVSVGWAAGLPLSLWRMILWMETEEMALGELLERLRTVIQTIGGKCESDVLWQEDESSNQLRAEIPTLIPADSSEEGRVRDRETQSQPRRTRT
ncbi:hypothetical protein D4764_01G0008750 [Takifugu flavidus]|uniref:Uncharacterized protein n=1 Tax=Takifugu flavidus TaxID=433684 RepID=A0A5C6PS10_9TELE|nr:hypothetical protein D4764_01G0008750 [Takifugu flavidus]